MPTTQKNPMVISKRNQKPTKILIPFLSVFLFYVDSFGGKGMGGGGGGGGGVACKHIERVLFKFIDLLIA